ncbi:hypothetical protein ACFFQW_27970 [Umezawaea endophytica]|uniref:Uncharacterized protein n=1 Tax=Umezawaea endophytica TaxID=1654476 RepID=A0A9X3A040_9PSEU|nr:hypothetical protein [Umezawaea endophytica]MCS7476593.1 hypothetical protein [Umezawaea endophytica]
MTVRSSTADSPSTPPTTTPEAVPTSRRDRRAKGKKSQVPPRAFSASVSNQRQYAVRRRG